MNLLVGTFEGCVLSTTLKYGCQWFSLLAIFTAWELSGAVGIQFQCLSDSSRELLSQIVGSPPTRVSNRSGCSPKFIFDKFPSDTDAAGWSGDPIAENHWSGGLVSKKSYGEQLRCDKPASWERLRLDGHPYPGSFPRRCCQLEPVKSSSFFKPQSPHL